MKGFAGMTPEQRREIAAKGGRAAQRAGTAHRWTRDEAAAAGRKGGGARDMVRKKGFAAMDPDAHEDISRAGGSHPKRGSR